jgi:ectoine hydroxylase-related dioxygenase (phytanoyl-CoA dioxygenase family)
MSVTPTASAISPGQPLGEAEQARVLETFHHDGVALVPGVLNVDECAALRDAIDRVFANAPVDATRGSYSPLVMGKMATHEAVYRDLAVREPFLSLAEAIVGQSCRYMDTVCIRNGPSKAIDFWHVDLNNYVEFPLPPEVPRHDPRIKMPVHWFSFQIALTDIESIEHGPTQFVPGSHYSGRGVPTQDNPTFEGRGPQSVLCRAGDIYLFNHQTWHRGSPNLSNRTRYLTQTQYGNTHMTQRFAYCGQHGITEEMLREADPRLRKLLGM